MSVMDWDTFVNGLLQFVGAELGFRWGGGCCRITAGWAGDKFCVLIGDNLKEGTAFFGDTPYDAFRQAFAAAGQGEPINV